jgi:hypothetical protein
MSTCVEVVGPSQNIPNCLPTIQQTNFIFPIVPSTRTLEPVVEAGLVDGRPTLLGSAVASYGRLVLCFHSEAAGFEDVYLTFAGADCENPDFEPMLGWLRAKISCWRGSSVAMGIGSSRVVAAIASRVAPPGGECIVAPGTEEPFLTPVSLQKLHGVVQSETRTLAEGGISTLGQLRQIPKPVLIYVFGDGPGRALWHIARGQDANKPDCWKLSAFSRPRSPRGLATRELGWRQRLCSLVSTRLEALDRVLEQILTVPTEQVPPRTTSLP